MRYMCKGSMLGKIPEDRAAKVCCDYKVRLELQFSVYVLPLE